MAFVIQPIDSDLAAAILSAVGETSPSADKVAQSQRIAALAESTIKRIRGLKSVDELEPEYSALALEMSIYMWNKVGIDGSLTYSENGVSQTFTAESFPSSMLGRITPYVRSC